MAGAPATGLHRLILSKPLQSETRTSPFLEIISLHCLSAVVSSLHSPVSINSRLPVIMVVYYQLAGKQVGSHVVCP